MLFLAVTGALMAGVLLATSASIGVQRYRDATESFKALIQQQYADIASVQNTRDNVWTCDTNGAVAPGDILRGQSDCVMLGKYMTITGGDITTYTVLAAKRATAVDTTNDITALTSNYALNIDKSRTVQESLEWDTTIAWAKEGNANDKRSPATPRSIALLFVRSPVSGQLYTFSTNSVPTKEQLSNATNVPTLLGAMIKAGEAVPGQQARTICLDPAGLISTPSVALYIAPFASGASSVEVRSNDVAGELGAEERC